MSLSTVGGTLSVRSGSLRGLERARTVTLTNTGAAKADWQAKIELTSANFDFADSDGTDLAFTHNGTPCSYWRESWDGAAQTATLWVRVPNVGASSSTTVEMSYGGAAADTSDIAATFLLGEDFRNYDDAFTGMFGHIGQTSYPALGNQVAYTGGLVALHGGAGTWKEVSVSEQSNIVWTGTEYVILVTGRSAANVYASGLFYATDLAGPWTEYDLNPVLPLAEDCYITVTTGGDLYRDASGWSYVTFERKPAQADTGIARTKNFRTDWEVWNGSAWSTTRDTHAAVLVRGAAGTWDDFFTGSPVSVHDGTQFICIYEGAAENAGPFATGVARSADGLTWTKEPTNPINSAEVIDDIREIDGTWWITAHGNGGNQFRYRATDSPTVWTNTSWTADPVARYEPNGHSVNFAFGTADADLFVTYQRAIGTTGIEIFNVLGGARWNGRRYGTPGAQTAPIYLDPTGSKFVMKPEDGVSHAICVWSATAPLTSDFMVVARRRQVPQTDDQYAGVGIGSGVPISGGTGNVGRAHFPDGYLFELTNPTQYIQIRKQTGGAHVIEWFTADATAAEANNYNLHEMSYRASGALDYRLAGTSRVSTTDTAHLAASKSLLLYQGGTSTAKGAISEYEYVFVRKFDGADLTATVA